MVLALRSSVEIVDIGLVNSAPTTAFAACAAFNSSSILTIHVKRSLIYLILQLIVFISAGNCETSIEQGRGQEKSREERRPQAEKTCTQGGRLANFDPVRPTGGRSNTKVKSGSTEQQVTTIARIGAQPGLMTFFCGECGMADGIWSLASAEIAPVKAVTEPH